MQLYTKEHIQQTSSCSGAKNGPGDFGAHDWLVEEAGEEGLLKCSYHASNHLSTNVVSYSQLCHGGVTEYIHWLGTLSQHLDIGHIVYQYPHLATQLIGIIKVQAAAQQNVLSCWLQL